MDYVNRAKEIQEEIIKYRRHIHENAEIGMDLPNTVGYVRGKLETFGYNVDNCGGGLTTTCGQSGKTLLIRADMDALKMTEENDIPFKSKNGNAHMCGHDMHTAILLGAAHLLKENESNLKGRVKFMFQPGEELMAGAKAMIKDGILSNPKVDAALGLHVITHSKNGILTYKPGGAFASISMFKIKVEGKGGHGSALEMTFDPIRALVQIYNAMESIVPRELSMFKSASCSIGKIDAGTMANVIPQTASMEGTLRCFNKDDNDKIISAIERIVKAVSVATCTDCTLEHKYLPALINDEELCIEMADCYETIDGLEFAQETLPVTGSEDFAFVAEKVPTMFLLLGVGEEGGPSNHNPNAIFYEDKMCLASAALANLATNWLAKQQQKDNREMRGECK